MSLTETLNKKIPPQEEIKKTFDSNNDLTTIEVSMEKITPVPSEKVDKMRRPTFEMPERDHKKLKAICTFEGVNVGDKLYEIVKEWLDKRELSFE